MYKKTQHNGLLSLTLAANQTADTPLILEQTILEQVNNASTTTTTSITTQILQEAEAKTLDGSSVLLEASGVTLDGYFHTYCM
jgi:hypothetical protein